MLLLAIILGSWLFQFSPDRLLGGEAAYMDVGVVSAEIQKLHSTAVAEEIAQLQPTATPVLLTPTPHLVTVPEPTAVPATIRSRSGDASLSVATVPAGQADEASALVMGEATSIAPQMARALQPSSVFSTPDSTSAELGLIELNDEVEVLGRTQVGNWLYVSTDDGALGFVFRPRFELMVEDDALMLIDPAEVKVAVSENAPASSAPADTSGQPLELDAFPLAGMGRCVDEYWVQTVYLEGRGGDGIYTYYWEDTLVAGPLIGEGFAFDVRHTGGQLIGTATVESGDGQSFSIELFVRQPEC